MERVYKNCTIRASREKALDGYDRVYLSAIDNEDGYIIVEHPVEGDTMTVWEAMRILKEHVDNYREDKSQYL